MPDERRELTARTDSDPHSKVFDGPYRMLLPLQSLRHADGRDRCICVLPESEHPPSGCPQLEVSVPVSEAVRLNLRPPPTRVGLWPGAVVGTAMPEAPIDKHCDLRSHEG